MTPTMRTLKHLRDQGIPCDIAERWIQFGPKDPRRGKFGNGFRKDLFGFIDIVAIFPDCIGAIQSCGQSFAAHDKKILENEFAPRWLWTDNRILLYGWRKLVKKKGGKLKVWKPRIKEYQVEDFPQYKP